MEDKKSWEKNKEIQNVLLYQDLFILKLLYDLSTLDKHF